MKEVSTAGTMQSRNISQQKFTLGLDLGDRNSWYCVVDEAGQIQREQRVRTSGKALQEVFGAMPRSRIALEIGTHSTWISRLLSALGHEVIVANARKVRRIGESRKKDDRLDAQTLARLARIDPELLYPVHRAKRIAPRECGWKHGDSGHSAGDKNLVQQSQRRIDLTPTGLLMEGHCTQVPRARPDERNGESSTVSAIETCGIRLTPKAWSQNSKTFVFSAFLSSSIAQSCFKKARNPLASRKSRLS